ncbi:MAG: PD40 domain-containing protein [Bacteroidaceae bacterium]|nr:PD40 domain-containing protein [Bacteroidaceae bacterium]
MKRLVTVLIVCMLFAGAHAHHLRMDSLVNVFGTSAKKPATAKQAVFATAADSAKASKIFPYLQPISSYEEVNNDIMSFHFSKADAAVQKLMATAKRKRQSTADLDPLVSLCQKGENGLRGVDKVIIVDSVVVDKKDFLKAYPISDELGTLTLSDRGDVVQYQTQMSGMMLRPVKASDTNRLHIVRYYQEGEKLTEGEAFEGLGIEGDVNYPFLMPDGQTFYFAARSKDGYGNYDLYATRYDSDSKKFYQAENMGFPYNSFANDYMLVVDEAANLGWFASDRYQPAGKVCVYTFIPNESRRTIDYESTDLDELCVAASLRSIAAMPLTDEQKKAKADAAKRIARMSVTHSAMQYKEFEFILNDAKTCYTLSDFKSAKAQKQCQEWLQKSKDLAKLSEQLQHLRETSPSSTQQILKLEKRIPELQEEVHALEKSIRAIELSKP